MKYLILIIAFISFKSQSNSQNKIKNVNSITKISKLGDTIEIDVNKAHIDLIWLNDTIEITRYFGKPYKFDLNKIREIKKDSSFTPTKEQIQRRYDVFGYNRQNCFSYALEKYFNNINIKTDSIFDENSFLEGDSFDQIIKTTFIKINEFSANKRKYLKQEIPDNTLIIFINNRNVTEHSIFYKEGVFYSKNGRFKPLEYNKIKDLLKIYYYTEVIQYYTLNLDVLEKFLRKTANTKTNHIKKVVY